MVHTKVGTVVDRYCVDGWMDGVGVMMPLRRRMDGNHGEEGRGRGKGGRGKDSGSK